MGNMQPLFRTAALGGFQKQDVLDYIEAVGREHAQNTERLEKELNESRTERETLERQLSEATQTLEQRLAEGGQARAELEAQLEALRAQLAQAEQSEKEAGQALSAEQDRRAEAELRAEALEQQLEQAQQRAQSLEERLKKAEPAAQAYERVKDRTAGIELEAHQRAMEIEAGAKEQVKAAKAELEEWIQKVLAGYGQLRVEMDKAMSQASGGLEQAKRQMAEVSDTLKDRDEALHTLLQGYQDAMEHRAPDPLPLEEE